MIQGTERFISSCSRMRDAIEFSANSVDFVPNRGEIVFRIFLQKEGVLGKTNYIPFSFSLGPIYETNMSEIDFSTCAGKSQFGSIFRDSRS